MAADAPTSYKILVFSWNTESISLCETLNSTEAAFNRSGYNVPILGTTLTTWRYDSDIPDFYPQLVQLIQTHNPDIVVIGFQEDRHPGSYFHSHLLPHEMPTIGYGLVKRTKLMGVGVTTYKGLKDGDPFCRGIRLSVYAKQYLVPLIEQEEKELRQTMANDGQQEYVCSSRLTRGKGGAASYLMLPGFGKLALICCHLPFNAKSLIEQRKYNNSMLRQNEINRTNTCFNNIIEQLVLFQDTLPAHVIYFGDFNYRIGHPQPATHVADQFLTHPDLTTYIQQVYQQYDELYDQLQRRNIYDFQEGIDNQGPTFIPTCKMDKNRFQLGTSWKTGKYDQRVPSWCDRILYQTMKDHTRSLKCIHYDRFDHGQVMSKSDHAAVCAVFTLE